MALLNEIICSKSHFRIDPNRKERQMIEKVLTIKTALSREIIKIQKPTKRANTVGFRNKHRLKLEIQIVN
jgi:exosome complex RNA-binding protein Rrp42 (RNase PH superfamily)